jgi:hypothetical protein
MSQPVEMPMPEHISWQKVDQLVRELGFAPHQVRELTIDYTGPRTNPRVVVEVVANSQIVRRTYDTDGGFNGVRVGPPQAVAE